MDSDEARQEAGDNEMSLYHIIKPEINFEPGTSEYDPRVYDEAARQFKKFQEKGWLVPDETDEHSIHIAEHTKFILSQEYDGACDVKSRVLEHTQPPIRVICPGRVYRNEAISARAHCFFHQVEGLYIDEDVSFTDLKQVLLTFAREMFGPDTKIRLRPSYFPFTEPSAEMDISCNICGGTGCAFCKQTGWVEILGCGMVDPNVLEANGIDSKKYKGYAFGMGVERITNLKYQVKDLRLFSENDVRFLDEFVSAN